jgi:hypothetical protein
VDKSAAGRLPLMVAAAVAFGGWLGVGDPAVQVAAQAAMDGSASVENCVVLKLDRLTGATTSAPCPEEHTEFRQGQRAGRQDLGPLLAGRTAAVARDAADLSSTASTVVIDKAR